MKPLIITAAIVLALASCKKKEETPSPATTTPTTTGCTNTDLLLGLELNSTFNDNSCNNHAITNNGATFVADRNASASKALNFDGTSYLNYPNAAILHDALPLTLSFWVSVDDSSDWAHNYFIQSNARPNGGYCGYLVRCNASGQIHITIGDTTNSTTIDAISSVILRSKTWTHYTAVVKGNNDVDIYINGQKDMSASVSGAGTVITYPAASSANLGFIGGVSFSTNNGRLKGKMDKIKMWNKALTATDVTAEYTSTN